MSSDIKTREALAHKKASELLGTEPDTLENPFTVLASPAWRGVESDIWRASDNKQSIILKHYHPDTDFYVDTKSAIQAAEEAGRLAVGPKVLNTSSENSIIAFEDLKSGWAAGGLHHATNADIRANVIAQKKHFQRNAKLSRDISIFDEINALKKLAVKNEIFTHRDIKIFADYFTEAEAKILSLDTDIAPCHRDGNTANIMVHENKTVKLIDFDLAANCDPFEDIGCHLVEYFECDADAREGFEEWTGTFNEGQFQRAMILGLADDMRWGLIGAIMAAQSPRKSLEFGKYSAWRFLRLEMHIKRSDANDRIRKAA